MVIMRWSPLLLVAVGFAVYANSLMGGFFFLDDIESVKNNWDIRQLFPLWRDPDIAINRAVNSRPMIRLSLAMNYAIHELHFTGYRIINVFIHLLNGLTLFGLLRGVLRSPAISRSVGAASVMAFAVALLWLVHPLQSQCVNHVIQRSTSLMAFFYLLTMYCASRGFAERKKVWFFGAVSSCALGMATKEAMVTAPLMVLLFERALFAESFVQALRRHWRFYLGLVSTTVVLVLLLRLRPHGNTIIFTVDATAWHYLLNQFSIIAEHYLGKIFWPYPLTNFYGPIRFLHFAEVWPQAILIFLLLTATVVGFYMRPAYGFWGVWYFLILVPTSTVVPIFWEAMAERRVYLPLVGPLMLLALLVDYLWHSRTASSGISSSWKGYVPLAMLVLVPTLILASITVSRNQIYQDDLKMWGAEVAVLEEEMAETPHMMPKVLLHYSEVYSKLAQGYERIGDLESATAQYERALEVFPGSFRVHFKLGHMYQGIDQADRAIEHFRKAVRLYPDYYQAHDALGVMLCMKGSVDEGISYIRRALEIRPNYIFANHNLGVALGLKGKNAEAIKYLERALHIAPTFEKAQDALADISSRPKQP